MGSHCSSTYCVLIMILLLSVFSSFLLSISCLSYNISTTWNGYQVRHVPVQVDINSTPTGDLAIAITAPFFLSLAPPPDCVAGKPYPGLWNYEVVEVFFLEPETESYVELEFSPCGAHLALLLHPERVDLVTYLPLDFTARVNSQTKIWTGQAVVPHEYLPPSVSKFNAYAIHGVMDGEEDLAWEDDKLYESLFPVDHAAAAPDFHNLRAFEEINLEEIGVAVSEDPSDIWRAAMDGKQLSGLLP